MCAQSVEACVVRFVLLYCLWYINSCGRTSGAEEKKKKKLVGLNNDNIFLTYANHVACEYVCPLSDTTIGSLQSTNVEWGDIEAKD